MAGTIVCYGDSNTYGYDPCTLMEDQYPEQNRWTGILESETKWKIENHGICGRCIPHTGSQIRFACEQLKDWQDKDAPVWMWIMLGTNDLLQEQQFTAKDTAQRMETFLKKLMAEPAVSSGKITLYLIAPARMEYGAWVDEERLYQESRQLGEEYKKSQNAWESALRTLVNGTSQSYTMEYIFQKKDIIYLHRTYRRKLHG